MKCFLTKQYSELPKMWLRKVTLIFGECEPDTVNWFWSLLQAKSLLEKVSAWWDGVEMGRNP